MKAKFSYALALLVPALMALAAVLSPLSGLAAPEKQLPESQVTPKAGEHTLVEGGSICDDGFTISGVWFAEPSELDNGKLYYARHDKDGNVKWSYKGMDTFGHIENNNRLRATSDGGAIACYGRLMEYNYYENYIMKIDASGQLEWKKDMGSAYKDLQVDAINETSYGYLLLMSGNILRLDKQGNILSGKALDIPDTRTMDENFMVADWESTMAQLDENGNITAGPVNTGPGSNYLVASLPDGYLVVNDTDSLFSVDLIKLDKNMNEAWRRSLPRLNGLYANGTYVIDGKYYVGFFEDNGDEMRVYDSNGTFLGIVPDVIKKAMADHGWKYENTTVRWVMHDRLYIFGNGGATDFKEYIDLKPYLIGGGTTPTPTPTPTPGTTPTPTPSATQTPGTTPTPTPSATQTPGTTPQPTESPAKSGWVQEGNTWYYYENGAPATGWKKVGGSWYYMDRSGKMVTGWQQDGSTWYYLKPSGAMATGWVQDGNTWYYMNGSGAMQTGWVKSGSGWYYMKPSGAMATGWVNDGTAWYYTDGSGKMVTGTHTIDGKRYTFNSSGVWVG